MDPKPDEVFIEDIAHALAYTCRFGAHCKIFYSVAEHSLLVSQVVPAPYALCGLMHDATEAYVTDVPRPLKTFLSGYKAIEQGVWRAIATKFGLPLVLPVCVKGADDAVLLAEADLLMSPFAAPWNIPGEPAPVTVTGYSPAITKEKFLNRFYELTGM